MGELVNLKFHVGGTFFRKNSELKYISGIVEEIDVDPDLIFVAGLKSLIEERFECLKVAKLYYGVSELPLASGLKVLDGDESIRDLTAVLVSAEKVDIYSEHVIDLDSDEGLEVDQLDGLLNSTNAELDGDLEAVAADLEVEEAEHSNMLSAQQSLIDEDSNLVTVPLLAESVRDVNNQCSLNVSGLGRSGRKRSNEIRAGNKNTGEGNICSDSGDIDNDGDEEDDFMNDNEWLSDNDDCEVQEARNLIRAAKLRKATCQPLELQPTNVAGNNGWFNTEASMGTCADSDGSEYFSSDEDGSYVDDSDEENDQALRVKSNAVYYQETDDPKFELSMIFESRDQVKNAMTAYAVKNGKKLRTIKNDKARVRYACKSESCSWKISIMYEKSSDNWIVKTLVDKHDCNWSFTNNRITAKWLAAKYAGRIRASPRWSAREFRNTVKEEYRVEVTEKKCRNAKMLVMKQYRDSFKEEYSKLHDYIEAIKSSNVDSSAYIQVQDDTLNSDPVFRKLYICFSACKHGFLAGCRKVIGLDGCFLKGLIKGELLSAVGRDANNQMYPIAWAVVEVESKESWTWFLQGLMRDLKLENGYGWTLITDQQKGLIPAISELLPRAEHRMCARHIYANFRKKHPSKHLQRYFWKCAKSTTIPHYEKAVGELRAISSKAAADLVITHPQHWCRAYFDKRVKCDVVDNNMSETFNAWIIEARHKPIISMLEDIRIKVLRRVSTKIGDVKKWQTDYCPRILTKLANIVKESSYCHLEWNGEDGFEVQHHGDRFVVDIKKETCTCNAWDLSGILCPHAVCAIFHEQKQPQMYLHECYCKDTYMKAYVALQPLNGPSLWPNTNMKCIQPPILRKMPGRPKLIKRRREEHEPPSRTRMSRAGVRMTCKICKQVGHNKLGCPKRKSEASQGSSEKNSNAPRVVQRNGASQRGFGLFTSRSGAQIFNPDLPGEQVLHPPRFNGTQRS